MIEINNQLSTLSQSLLFSWTSSENEVTRLYVSVPKVRKLYKFLNDRFSKMKHTMDNGEKELFWYFKLSHETFMTELNYLIEFTSTIRVLVKGKERNLYTKRQINSWNKTHKQLMEFEEKYKKHVIGFIRQIPCDLTEIIASYL